MSQPDQPVSRETEDRFSQYEELLQKWQKTINLVGPDTLKQARQRHIDDSVQLAAFIPAKAKTLFDLGSGAGFPGLVLAMMRPDMDVHLVESDQRKCAFLKTVSRETKTPVSVHNRRIEDLTADLTLPTPDIVTARALASLSVLIDYVRPWAKRNPALTLILPKGARAEDEVAEARSRGYQFAVDVKASRTSKEASVLIITGLD